MASKPKLTPQMLEENVLARLAAGVEYGPEMQRARYEKNKMAYPNAPGPVDEDMDYRQHIAGIMARLNQPMPAPAGSNYYYTQPQYEAAMQQFYMPSPDAAERRQIFMDKFRQSMAGQMPGAAPILPQGFQRLPDATFAGGRDYAAPQGPEYQPGFLNRLRAMLGY